MSSPAAQTASARTSANPIASMGNSLHTDMSDPQLRSIYPPEEQQDVPPMLEEDAHSVIGLSISRAQTRLMSPQTPVAEKVAAMGGLGGVDMFDGAADCDESIPEDAGLDRELQVTRRLSEEPFTFSEREDSLNLPSPWRASSRPFERIKTQGQDQQKTEPASILPDLNVRRYISSLNLPSFLKVPNLKDLSIPSVSSLLGSTRSRPSGQNAASRQKRAGTINDLKSTFGFVSQAARQPNSDHAVRAEIAAFRFSSDEHQSREPHQRNHQGPDLSTTGRRASLGMTVVSAPDSRLHRSTSDQSLMLRRVTSTGSSLGDDSRWENVQDQVNSRFKAIKDSLQDSSIRLPKMPNVSSLNLNAFRPDFTRPRAQSEGKSPMGNAYEPSAQANIPAQGQRLLEMESTPLDKKSKSTHSHLEQALENMIGDLVVMGGYRGSILRSAKAPHRQLWVPIKVGLNIRKVDLEVGLQPEDEEDMKDHIFASGMLSHIGPVDMGRRLLKRLRACKNAQEGSLRVHDYGYDWRLSPHLLSRRLIEFLERLPSNADGVRGHQRGAIILAHSMGGLITRHAVNQRPELFRGVVYAGVPQHCVNILGPLRNGDEVLLSSNVLTAQVNFTLRSSFLLLPEDGRCFINKGTKEEYPVNFFDVEHWRQYAWSPCISPALPPAHSPENKGLLGSMGEMLPSLPSFTWPSRKPSVSRSQNEKASLTDTAATASTNANTNVANAVSARSLDPQMAPSSVLPTHSNAFQSTIPLPDALAYLKRTLDQTLRFKSEMACDPNHTSQNLYPPLAILYATNTPTVAAARVASRDDIRRTDAYDDLQFASGDGVCLARAAMLPPGYSCAKGGRVRTERGHVGLLGDLEAVGKLLTAVIEDRRRGTGLGMDWAATYR